MGGTLDQQALRPALIGCYITNQLLNSALVIRVLGDVSFGSAETDARLGKDHIRTYGEKKVGGVLARPLEPYNCSNAAILIDKFTEGDI